MEAKHYPIWLIMYHPEYQLLKFYGPKKWNLASFIGNQDDLTDEIGFRVSLKVNREARKNNNSVKGIESEFMSQWGVSRIPAQSYPMVPGLDTFAYGYNMKAN